MSALLGASLPGAAAAVDAEGEATTPVKQKTLADYYADLGGDDAPERLYAARYVKGELLRASWAYKHASPGSLVDLDARSLLTEMDNRVPGACESALNFDNSAVLCAEMLAELENASLLRQVQAAADRVANKGEQRRFVVAIAKMEAASPPGPAALPTPTVASQSPEQPPAPPLPANPAP